MNTKNSVDGSRRYQKSNLIKSQGSRRLIQSQHSRRSNLNIQTKISALRVDKLRETGMKTILDPQSNRKYLTMIRKGIRGPIQQDHEEVKSLSNTIFTRINQMLKDQNDEKFLSRVSLPKLPPPHHPVICRVDGGRIAFIAHNDAHSKESNFGYTRNKFGGFYNH